MTPRSCRLIAADGSHRVVPRCGCTSSDLIACLLIDDVDVDDDEGDADTETMMVDIPLPGIPSEAVLRGVAAYMDRVATAGGEPVPRGDDELCDYRLSEVVGVEWGDAFFREATGGGCGAASVCALLQAAEYMQMEGLRWLCAARLACAIRDTPTEVELCGLFGVPLESMDGYEEDMAEVCTAIPWLAEGAQ